jgi:hypothetical protein
MAGAMNLSAGGIAGLIEHAEFVDHCCGVGLPSRGRCGMVRTGPCCSTTGGMADTQSRLCVVPGRHGRASSGEMKSAVSRLPAALAVSTAGEYDARGKGSQVIGRYACGPAVTSHLSPGEQQAARCADQVALMSQQQKMAHVAEFSAGLRTSVIPGMRSNDPDGRAAR